MAKGSNGCRAPGSTFFIIYCGTAVCRVRPIYQSCQAPRHAESDQMTKRAVSITSLNKSHLLYDQGGESWLRHWHTMYNTSLLSNCVKLQQSSQASVNQKHSPVEFFRWKPISVLARERIHTSEVAMQIQHKHGEVFFFRLR